MSTTTTPEAATPIPLPNDGEPIRLNIGGGDTDLPGYIVVDRSVGLEAYPLGLPDESVDEVYASHVIEHFDRAEVTAVIMDWYRVLKPGGKIRIATPDVSHIAHLIANGQPFIDGQGEARTWGAVLSGGQKDANDYHKCHMDYSDLADTLGKMGAVAVRQFEPFALDCSQYPFSANVEAIKPSPQMMEAASKDRVAGCRTVPRLGWTRTAERMAATAVHAGVTFDSFGGAYTDLGFERAIGRAHSTGREFILVTDYDTVWEPDDVLRLVVLADLHPDADCIAAMQMRRGIHHILFSDRTRNHTHSTFVGDIVPVESAHFGLTLFRSSAFDEFPMPWFRHRDTEDGKVVEADMSFWEKWRESGRSLFLARHVPVGHMEEFIVWPGADLKAKYQTDMDYDEHGMPTGIRA